MDEEGVIMDEKDAGRKTHATRVLEGPARASYRLSGLASVGTRLFRPPQCRVSDATPTVGAVRSLKRTPVTQIQLDAMLTSKYLPPFTLREYEDWLVFEERSVENLYATVWARQYAKDYKAFEEGKGGSSEPELKRAFEQGVATFFTPGVPLEVNIPSIVRTKLLNDALHHFDPSILASAQAIVEDNLRESLNRFVAANLGNAGAKRMWFALVVGAASVLLGIGLVVLFCLIDANRAWRTCALPLYWLGLATFYGGLGRSCIVLFLFGAVRQLHPWEMERSRPTECPPSPEGAVSVILPREGPATDANDIEKALDELEPRPEGASGHSSNRNSLAWFPFEPEEGAYLPPMYPASVGSAPRRKSSAPMFAPITAVTDPVAIRSQRDRILHGIVYGFIGTALLAAPTFAVPNR